MVEVNTLIAERNAYREELNNFRRELYEFRPAASTELRQLYGEYAAQLAHVYDKETEAFCELRDKSFAEIDERLARPENAK